MININIHRFKGLAVFIIILLSVALLGACGEGSKKKPETRGLALTLDMDLPDSITGGPSPQALAASQQIESAAKSDSDIPCAYLGSEEEDPFRNGYEMTKFMVSAIATWTCWADTLIEIANGVAHDGIIHETDNDTSQENYDAEDPTHYQINDESKTQTTIRFYYAYDRTSPPQQGDDPQFFLSWNASENGDILGRLIIDGEGVNTDDRDPDDPTLMRMDFNFDDTQEVADMFLQFDDNNDWAEGFRIQVTKDLTAGPLEQVFTALGLIKMKAQFFTSDDITEIPNVHMFTVADTLGEGAALAKFEQIALPLELNQTGNHLGNYLFDKDDIYFFDHDGNWDWIEKSIADASYRGSRTTPATGGTWIPIFDPSLDMVATELALGADYFTGSKCADIGDDCTDLLNAVFADGFADQEPNQGIDPMDWRSDAIATPVYLNSIYPNGFDWSGAFDYAFTP
jgi:hypothetical protein